MRVLKKLAQGLGVLVLVAMVTGCVYQQVGLRRDAKRYPAPGELVDVGNHKMHIWCEGEAGGKPAIILDGGATWIASGFGWLVEDLARDHRVCAFDRSGFGWSEPGPEPMDGHQQSGELHRLVEEAGIDAPFIYVGHSLGGMLGRVYYDLYPDDLAGLVMIEPGDPDIFLAEVEEERGEPVERTEGLRPCVYRCAIATVVTHLGVTRLAINLTDIDLLQDPKFPKDAADAFLARMMRPETLRSLLISGRYVTRTIYQTRDNISLGDLPTMVIYSSGFGSLLGESEDAADLASDLEQSIVAWGKTTATSSQDMGVRRIEGANHLWIIAHQEYAAQVADLIREVVVYEPTVVADIDAVAEE